MPVPSLLAAPLMVAAFAFADPAGDAHGDGYDVLPTRPALSADALDLREFRAEANGDPSHESQGKTMRFTVSYGAAANPWRLASGFSAGVTDIFVKTGLSGSQELGDLNLKASGGSWTYHLRVSGAGASLEQLDEPGAAPRPLAAPTVRLEGTSLVIGSAIPAGDYGYWVSSSVYSPLTGIVKPSTQAGATGLKSLLPDAPVPVDVLAAADDHSAYTTRQLAAVGQANDLRPYWLGGFGLLGLGMTTLASLRLTRSSRRAAQARPVGHAR